MILDKKQVRIQHDKLHDVVTIKTAKEIKT